MDAVMKLLRLGVTYMDAITMPTRVIARMFESDRERKRRIVDRAKRGKAMGVFDLSELD